MGHETKGSGEVTAVITSWIAALIVVMGMRIVLLEDADLVDTMIGQLIIAAGLWLVIRRARGD